jgi:hypothetical protein
MKVAAKTISTYPNLYLSTFPQSGSIKIEYPQLLCSSPVWVRHNACSKCNWDMHNCQINIPGVKLGVFQQTYKNYIHKKS